MAQHQERKIVHIKDVFGGKPASDAEEDDEGEKEDIFIMPQIWNGGINKPSAASSTSFVMGSYRPKILGGGSELSGSGSGRKEGSSGAESSRTSMPTNHNSNFIFAKVKPQAPKPPAPTTAPPAPPGPPPPPPLPAFFSNVKKKENSPVHLSPVEKNIDTDSGHTHVTDLENGSITKSSDSGVDDFDIQGFMTSYTNKEGDDSVYVNDSVIESTYVNDVVRDSLQSLPSASSGVDTDDYMTPSEARFSRNTTAAVPRTSVVDEEVDSGHSEASGQDTGVDTGSRNTSTSSGEPVEMEFMEDEAMMELDSEEDELTSELPRYVYREYQGEDFSQFLQDDNFDEIDAVPVAKPRFKKKKRKTQQMSPTDTQGSSSSKENDKKTLKKKINQVFNQTPAEYIDDANKQSIHNYSFANSKMASVFGDQKEAPKLNGGSDSFDTSNTLSNKWWAQEMVTTHTATGNLDILLKPRINNPSIMKDSALHDMLDQHLPSKHDYEDFEQARKAIQFDSSPNKNKASKNSLWRKLSNSFRKREKSEDFLNNQAVNPLTAQFNMDL